MAEILLGNIKGPKGVTFTPAVDSNGNLSWTNDGGLTNPPSVNIKGPKGDQGPAGEGGGSGDAIPKTGDRGLLAGYGSSQCIFDLDGNGNATRAPVTINEYSPDVLSIILSSEIIVEDGAPPLTDQGFPMAGVNQTWTKVIFFMDMFAAPVVTLGSMWMWVDNQEPALTNQGLLVLHWNGIVGVAAHVGV